MGRRTGSPLPCALNACPMVPNKMIISSMPYIFFLSRLSASHPNKTCPTMAPANPNPNPDILSDWSVEAKINVNIKKCGLLYRKTPGDSPTEPAILLLGKPILVVQSYNYLGFPVRSNGINFEEHLRTRLSQANGRASFLRLYSDGWGPAHRLCVYKQFLAPMFEYGAPLVWTWATQSDDNMAAFRVATDPWKDLVGWISVPACSSKAGQPSSACNVFFTPFCPTGCCCTLCYPATRRLRLESFRGYNLSQA